MRVQTPSRQGAPPSFAPPGGRTLQRQCACGRHTQGRGECANCRQRGARAVPAGARPVAGLDSRARHAPPACRPKAEAAFGDVRQDGRAKVELGSILAGAGIGVGLGALVGGLAGGPLGALIGAGAGALIGAVVGALAGSGASGGINWAPANYTAVNAAGSSTTVETPFVPAYTAAEDVSKGVWRLNAGPPSGGVNITVHTGGSRDPIASPPTSEAEAQQAVTDMKGYYARGSRGAWHTEAASRAHEMHHFSEWKCASEHYWPAAKTVLDQMTAPRASHPNAAAAVTAMRAGAAGADAKMQAFQNIAHQYWFTLADNAGSRPYAAGQLVLNNAIESVQQLAASRGWTVPAGTDTPSAADPCYQPWLPFTP